MLERVAFSFLGTLIDELFLFKRSLTKSLERSRRWSDQVVEESFCNAHIRFVRLTDYDVVDEMPMLRSRVHPRCFVPLGLSEKRVCDCEVKLCTQRKKPKTICIHAP